MTEGMYITLMFGIFLGGIVGWGLRAYYCHQAGHYN